MKKCLLLTIILFSCPIVFGDQIIGENEIIFNYFQSLIDDGHTNLNLLIEGNKAELLSANVFNVSKDLKKHNVNHTILNIAPVFEEFYNSINNITINYNNMIKYRDVKNSHDYIIFKTSLKNVHRNLMVLNDSLNKIDNIALTDKDGKVLKFDTSNVRSDINTMLKDTIKYSNKLNKIKPEGFVIYSDKNSVFINSNITIYGYVGNNIINNTIINKTLNKTANSITLYHNNISYNITLKNNSFSKTFLLNKLGNHIFYAKSSSKTSNILNITCLKIPTYIDVIYNNKEYVGNNANLKIKLYDYYGNELRDNIYIHYLNKHETVRAPTNLSIKSNLEKNITVNIIYNGNNIHNNSKKTITINFVRIPTYITANYNKDKIIGNLFDKNNNLLNNKIIYLVIDNKTYTSKTKNGIFEFNISNNSLGRCYIFFKGDYKYLPSKKLINDKNIMPLFSKTSNNGYILSFIILIILMVLISYRMKKHENMVNINAKSDDTIYNNIDIKIKNIYSEFEKYISNKKYVEGIIKAYCSFVNKLNIKKSLTPREICNRYNHIKGLKTITKIFEKVYYGNIKPEKEDIEKYDKFFKED
ncbi:hypothetical protein [Methanothermococcus okinawensis]|uniref:DUF4129 domain-containing protein n=1 Tax=Methanothermococcus okinawensis (strain DSM 14208 / JCM 11175 / IH1) TaxID=647113 RepID=F8AJT6_METOI|nr:hypothetical protein [Methanothermococcus okinawensis]AEH07285.1 hypothetical protein Metok_1319 [Methanothermococcus okinawensis IH1]